MKRGGGCKTILVKGIYSVLFLESLGSILGFKM